MKKSNTLILSTTVLAFLTTGCVKKPVPVTASPATTQPVYDGAVIYEDAAPIVYDNGAGAAQSGVIYGSEVPADTTVITTDGAYGQPVGGNGAYGQTQSGAYGQAQAGGTYSQPQTGTYNQPSGGGGIYGQPVSGGYNNNDPYTAPATGSYGGGYNDTPPAPQGGGGGIHLQVAALRDYAGAEAYKNSLSLDPRYSAYVQRGAVNKVIVTGIGSVSEANQLKETRFPGAFIVSGNSGGGGYAPSASSTGAYSGGGYTVNEPYGSTPSSSSSYGGSYNGGLGVQIGAFSSRSKAQSVANSQGGRYPAKVKTATSNGRTIYKVILTGFSSESSARSYASSHNGFIVH